MVGVEFGRLRGRSAQIDSRKGLYKISGIICRPARSKMERPTQTQLGSFRILAGLDQGFRAEGVTMGVPDIQARPSGSVRSIRHARVRRMASDYRRIGKVIAHAQISAGDHELQQSPKGRVPVMKRAFAIAAIEAELREEELGKLLLGFVQPIRATPADRDRASRWFPSRTWRIPQNSGNRRSCKGRYCVSSSDHPSDKLFSSHPSSRWPAWCIASLISF